MLTVVDQLNRPILLKEPAKRIVSLVPSISEYLYDLGLEDEVVGITKFCIKPNHWFESKKRIGGTKTISIDKIRDLNPDLILANKEENTKEEIEELAKHFNIYISDIETLHQTYQCLLDIGFLTGKPSVSKKLISEIKEGVIEVSKTLEPISCLYFIWQKPFLVAGKNTFINDILGHLGFQNLALKEVGRYPELTRERIEHLNPRVILLSSEPFPFAENHLTEFQERFPKSKVVLVDGEAFSWYGSRLKHSIAYFKSLKDSLTT